MEGLNDEDGHPAYALTDAGLATAEIVAALTHALDQRDDGTSEESNPSQAA